VSSLRRRARRGHFGARRGRADHHEGQLTYGDFDLVKVLDTGAWWQAETGLPLPLGLVGIRRDVARAADVAAVLREAIDAGLANRGERWPTPPLWPGIDDATADEFVAMYVNELTLDMGERGRQASRRGAAALRTRRPTRISWGIPPDRLRALSAARPPSGPARRRSRRCVLRPARAGRARSRPKNSFRRPIWQPRPTCSCGRDRRLACRPAAGPPDLRRGHRRGADLLRRRGRALLRRPPAFAPGTAPTKRARAARRDSAHGRDAVRAA